MTDAPDLLPCPFCAVYPSYEVAAFSTRHRISCEDCEFEMQKPTREEAQRAWNTRDHPMTVAEAAKVRETDDEAEVMRRLIEGERIFYSQDGKAAWLSDADRAHVSYRVVWALRNQGYLTRVSSEGGRVFCDEASDSLRALSQGGE